VAESPFLQPCLSVSSLGQFGRVEGRRMIDTSEELLLDHFSRFISNTFF